MANQIHEELEKWLTISNFLFCTVHPKFQLILFRNGLTVTL